MGYTPQLLVGTWVGCDDRFIRNEGAGGFGSAAARPIAEAFLQKVFADKTLGIEKTARFAVPAELENQMNSADPLESIDLSLPGAQGEDIGAGSEQDYMSHDYIGPESQPVIEDDPKPKRNDSIQERRTNGTPIGAPVDEPKKKKGFFNKLFGKKDKQ